MLLQSMTKYYLLINATSENYVTNITGANATALEDNATQIRNTENASELLHQLSSNTTYNDDNGVGLHYILGVATLLVSVMTVIGNGSLLWVILKTSLLRTVTNSFIVSLAVSDLIVGFLIMPYCAGMSVDIISHVQHCKNLGWRQCCNKTENKTRLCLSQIHYNEAAINTTSYNVRKTVVNYTRISGECKQKAHLFTVKLVGEKSDENN